MVEKHARKQQYPPHLRELIARGSARPASRRLSDVLTKIGPRHGPVSDAGTRALQEQRGDVV